MEAGGDGTLNLNDSGLTTVSDTTKLWSTGTINLDGGSLATGSFDNSDTGTLNFHDGTLTVNGASGVFNPGTNDFTIDGNTAPDLPELVIADTASATLTGFLKVGSNRQGNLTVESGGVVATASGYLGYAPTSTGIATVTGFGSQWNNSEPLIVGNTGSGTLNIEAGGAVSNTDGYLAWEAGGIGAVAVIGTGSTWANSGDLHVGKSGSVSVNITDSSEVQVGGMTKLYAMGTVNIDGGTMSVVETLELDAGSTVNLNSGTLSVTSFSGDGSLIWNGGTLEITAPTGLTVGADGLLGTLLTIDADQTLNMTNTTTIESGARIIALGGFTSDLLKIESGGQFDAPSGFTNQDEIQLSGADARITGGVLTNDGLLRGTGRIASALANQAGGEVRVAAGQQMHLTDNGVQTNAGRIEAIGNAMQVAEIEFDGALTNNGQVEVSNGTLRFSLQVTNNASGFISSQGTSTIRFNDGLDNSGNILLSFSSSSISGNIQNHPGGMILLAGNSTATFVGNMVNNGTVNVGGGNTSGSGNYPGTGLIEFIGGFSPGSSPAAARQKSALVATYC